MIWRCSGRRAKDVVCFTFALVPPLIVRNLTPFVSGFAGGGAPRSIADAVVARVVGPSSLDVFTSLASTSSSPVVVE